MLQVFHMDVTKVDQDVVYVAMAIYVSYQHPFKMFNLFQTYVASVLSECCICLNICCMCMLQIFHLFQTYVTANV